MKYFISIFLLITIANARPRYPEGIHVTFLLHAPGLPADTTVYVAGSVEQLGNWNPGAVSMTYQNNDTWRLDIVLPSSKGIEYKYTLGSWDHEGADSGGGPLSNAQVMVTSDTIIHDEIGFWTKGARPKEIHGQITGTVKYHRSLKGEGLLARDLIVWLPPGYETNPKRRYTVLYMHDGQNIIDPATSSFGVDWSVDETCDSLIRHRLIKPMIVVGIYNTSDRMSEYTPGERGKAYMNFILHTVKPFIDSAYRTLPDRRHTLIGGSSAGGTISFMLAWEHPEVFAGALCFSPAFTYGDWDLTRDVAVSHRKRSIFIYLDIGGVGIDATLKPGVDSMISRLKERGYREGKDFVFIDDPEAQHSESAWAKRFSHALQTTLRAMPAR